MNNPIATVFITTLGFFFWLWARGGRLPILKREIDEIDQVFHAPAAAPLLSILAIVLIPLGLYLSFQVGLLTFIVSLIAAPLIAGIIFRPFWKGLNRK